MKADKAHWRLYLQAVKERKIPSFRDLGLPVGQSHRRGFVGSVTRQTENLNRLVEIFDRTYNESSELDEEEKLVELARKLRPKIESSQVEKVAEILDAGFPINFQEPFARCTPLHIATSAAIHLSEERAVSIIELVLSYNPDVLIKDIHGKLPLHNCVFFHVPEPVRAEIRKRTHTAAKEAGVNLREDFKQYYESWMEKGFVGLKGYLDHLEEERKKNHPYLYQQPE